MRRSRMFLISTSTRLLIGLLFAISALPLGAQPATESPAGQGFGAAYDAARETTLTGTIQEIVTKHVAGSPAGMHLLVTGPDGVVDTHVGSYLSTETKEALRIGTPVQIIGAPIQLDEKEYFLARELTVNGRTITIRNVRGFLVHLHSDRIVQTKAPAQADTNGGAR